MPEEPLVPLDPPEVEPDPFDTFVASEPFQAMKAEVEALRTHYFGVNEDKFRRLDSLLTILTILR